MASGGHLRFKKTYSHLFPSYIWQVNDTVNINISGKGRQDQIKPVNYVRTTYHANISFKRYNREKKVVALLYRLILTSNVGRNENGKTEAN